MIIENKLEPSECTGIEDIRKEIDCLDSAVIKIIGRRLKYVLAASRFKTSETSVRAPERFKEMISKRREWAEHEGISPDLVEKVYTIIVNYFIEEEMTRWNKEK